MGARRIRREQIQHDQALSRLVNGKRKVNETQRRDQRMMAVVKKGHLPFTPPVMSWLSRKTNKPSSKITAQDVQKLLSAV